MSLAEVFTPDAKRTKKMMMTLITSQVIIFIFLWSIGIKEPIPKPWEIPDAILRLFSNGLIADLITSVALYLEALVLASIFSLGLAYLSLVPFFEPLAEAWSKLRFMGLVGVPFLFEMYIHSVHGLKLALLTFSISVFMVTSMLDVVDFIPKEKFDLARTLQMSEWGVLWEVVVLGRIDVAFDVIRQNAAIGWMMLPMIEGLFKSEGGIGAVMDIQNRDFHLEVIVALQLMVIIIGLLQDYGIGALKKVICPYADLLLERR